MTKLTMDDFYLIIKISNHLNVGLSSFQWKYLLQEMQPFLRH